MVGVRLILKDHQWTWIEPHLPGKSSAPGRTGEVMEAVLWLAGAGSPRRDLHAVDHVERETGL
jgi:transposase